MRAQARRRREEEDDTAAGEGGGGGGGEGGGGSCDEPLPAEELLPQRPVPLPEDTSSKGWYLVQENYAVKKLLLLCTQYGKHLDIIPQTQTGWQTDK